MRAEDRSWRGWGGRRLFEGKPAALGLFHEPEERGGQPVGGPEDEGRVADDCGPRQQAGEGGELGVVGGDEVGHPGEEQAQRGGGGGDDGDLPGGSQGGTKHGTGT